MAFAKQMRVIALSTVALLVLGTAGASAASKIGTNQIKNGAITSSKIKHDAVTSKKIKNGAVTSDDLKNGSVSSGDLKDGTVGTKDLANDSVTAGKIAPGAIAFPNGLWGTVIRNQTGSGAQSGLQTGPTGQPMGKGSLLLSVAGPNDLAAFGDSFDFAGVALTDITSLSYSAYNPDTTPAVEPSLRMEINPHLVNDAVPGGVLEFSTLIYEPVPGATGWVTYSNIQNDQRWYLTGDDGTTTGCTQAAMCTYAAVLTALAANNDGSGDAAISSGVYFGLGKIPGAPATTAVDKFVFNSFTFDFEPTGVFMTTP
jgi:hypothetical protein